MDGKLPSRQKNGFFTKRKEKASQKDSSTQDRQTQTDDDKISWRDGRRIVELGFLADQLKECQHCKSAPLQLSDCLEETRYGFGSVLQIKCVSWKAVNLVHTGKRHKHPNKQDKGIKIFDINTKCALAMIHCGLGPEQMNSLFSTLNIPPLTVKAMKEREREIGKSVESTTLSTCEEAIIEEEQLSVSNPTDTEEPGNDEKLISVSFDGAWQKRGSGRCYNSRTGHATFIGEKSGKCISYGVKSTDCRKCLFTDDASDHDCRKNYGGSAKSMEFAIAVELVSSLVDSGYRVESITIDEDSTTISRINSLVDPNVQKKSDKNHVKKTLSNSLYDIKKNNKSLSGTVINYLIKCVTYAIEQNKDDTAKMEQSISSIIPHAFGQHDQCDASWCGYLNNPDQYKHTGLPGGFDLTGEDLRQNLDRVLQNVAKKSEKLTNIGSSQSNESLNQIISTKVPRAKHFGGSESLNFRVAAVVAQKNVGRQYITDINQQHGLSPGKVTNHTNRSLDEKRKRKKEFQKLPSSKLARKKRKVQGFEQGLRNETKEGLTYCPGIALGPDGDKEHMDDLIEIPDPIRPVGQVPDGKVDQNTCMIVFDLETTGFGNNSEIIQLAAFDSKRENMFEKFILPGQPINKKAAEVTHMYSTGCKLYYKDKPVKTEPVKDVLVNFINWLPKRTILLAHNCRKFDAVILISHLLKYDLIDAFNGKVICFSDSLPIFKKKIPTVEEVFSNSFSYGDFT